MLNQIEAAMFEARGFRLNAIQFEQLTPRDVVARASKRVGNREERAEALGRTRQDAERKLLNVVVRP